jgi:hypothetical protein
MINLTLLQSAPLLDVKGSGFQIELHEGAVFFSLHSWGKFMNVKSPGFKSLSISALFTAFALISGAAHAVDTCPKLENIQYQASDSTFVSDDGKWNSYPLAADQVPDLPLTGARQVSIDKQNEHTVLCSYRGYATYQNLPFKRAIFIDMKLVDPKPAVPIINLYWTENADQAICIPRMNDTDSCPFELITPTAEVNVNPFGKKK